MSEQRVSITMESDTKELLASTLDAAMKAAENLGLEMTANGIHLSRHGDTWEVDVTLTKSGLDQLTDIVWDAKP